MYKKLLFTILSILFAIPLCRGVDSDVLPGKYQKLLVIYSENTHESDQRMQHTLTTALRTLKLNFHTVLETSDNVGEKIDEMGSEDIIIVNTLTITSFQVQAKLLRYVNGGGKLFLPFPSMTNSAMLNMAGIKDIGTTSPVADIKAEKCIFPGLEFITVDGGSAPVICNHLQLVQSECHVTFTAARTASTFMAFNNF